MGYSQTKKKILFVINTLGRAGAERALLTLLEKIETLNRQAGYEKYEISLFVLMGQGELIEEVPKTVKLLNPSFHTCSVLGAEGKKQLLLTVMRALVRRGTGLKQFPGMLAALLAMLRKKKVWPDKLLWRVLSDGAIRFDKEYDLAVAFLEGGAAYYVADHVKAKKKAAFIHIDYARAGYTRKLDRDCYMDFDTVFPISDEVKEHFLKVYPECADKTKVFHNLINCEKIKKMALQPGGFSDDFSGIRLLTVGRLTYQKAYPIAIEAMKLLKERNMLVRWYVLGDGPERQALQKKIDAEGLTKDFILLGAAENPYPYYAKCDIYVHATRFEGKSIAIQEAQTLGCAVIASDCSGNREQICNRVDGMLCELNAPAIRDAIETLILDKEKRKQLKAASAAKQIGESNDLGLLLEMISDDEWGLV